MKILKPLLLILAVLNTGCTVNYIHGTDVVLHQGEQGMESLSSKEPK